MAGEVLNRMVGNARKSQHQLDMEAMERGAMKGGSLTPQLAPSAPATAPEPDFVALSPEQAPGANEDAAAKMQAANLKAAKSDPSVQDKLNKMAALRAAYYGESK